MLNNNDIISNKDLPAIPAKRYFTVEQVCQLCGVTPHVLRYWEREFTQLGAKRKASRRYYQHHEVLLVRRIARLVQSEQCSTEEARSVLTQEALLHEAQAANRAAREQQIQEAKAQLHYLLVVLKA